MPGETFRTIIVPTGETKHTVVLGSGGSEYWDSLPAHQKAANHDQLAKMEDWLIRHLPEPPPLPPPPIPENLLASRYLTLGGALNRQIDPKTCTYITVANALRILGEPGSDYSLRALQQRTITPDGAFHKQLTISGVNKILSSGEPFDKFQATVVTGMFTFLRKLQTRKAVAIMNWPFSPAHLIRNDKVHTHARTVTGFTRNNQGLFFYFVDPYINPEIKVYSFRDLMVASLNQSSALANGVTPNSIDRVARSAWIIEKVS
ncbi:hypothetical protein A3B42_04450 [Candidatus Daviesbacteria bacterium RIFCSPLOWO2_01_FULL_38_10]|uniref:Uncharacterized protein n=1 Tax=Candidatus Daviesbacteria bacterium GW2011_GWF2_38_6 TaxID=1618432 RepID=A0A0G0K9W7_9BACT|nr:MAG: hypothetical protein US80_C0014G0005 [Candidatus Daviesbacteria bacterium GW2011_GWA2_38_17]KKQ76453.1 MAG: hypothetical protein US99_C0071G0007 [Candidatus Daviesbacteria bacterium GW2011_GWF2_38_6]OGE27490.1 MAG: hypothetical protein A3D02_00985 [Candidatus Daviesbacteria bacterium RIFCSPHIGHO2_02_FULL_39_41]OGE29944.1 MAG: hypothetical protein A2772_00890 [Candidatus Daviesbacteria bacterium RIFCSPHIGHO2_01_FULL_38_8b]OGE39011.1 MAG: hypothetical protein A3B42_04450 [Candidatus Davie